jgi:hypothetical protein
MYLNRTDGLEIYHRPRGKGLRTVASRLGISEDVSSKGGVILRTRQSKSFLRILGLVRDVRSDSLDLMQEKSRRRRSSTKKEEFRIICKERQALTGASFVRSPPGYCTCRQ